MYGKVLSAAIIPAAVILPNTGSNRTLAIFAATSIVIGVISLATTLGREVAKRIYKA